MPIVVGTESDMEKALKARRLNQIGILAGAYLICIILGFLLWGLLGLIAVLFIGGIIFAIVANSIWNKKEFVFTDAGHKYM
jgi:putative flippase GtrA